MSNFTQGAQTRIWFGLMPQESIVLYEATKIMQPPPDVIITLSAAAPVASPADKLAGFQTLAVTALTGPIANGTPLVFRSGTLAFYAYMAADAKTADANIRVSPLELAMPTGSVADHRGLIQMVGGTTANFKLEAEDESVMVFTTKSLDDLSDDLSGFMDGNAKSAKWSIDYESLSDSKEVSLARMIHAGTNVMKGVKGYVRKMNQPPAGMRSGNAVEGFVSVMGYEETNPADGMLKIKANLMGRGAPKTTRASFA